MNLAIWPSLASARVCVLLLSKVAICHVEVIGRSTDEPSGRRPIRVRPPVTWVPKDPGGQRRPGRKIGRGLLLSDHPADASISRRKLIAVRPNGGDPDRGSAVRDRPRPAVAVGRDPTIRPREGLRDGGRGVDTTEGRTSESDCLERERRDDGDDHDCREYDAEDALVVGDLSRRATGE